MSKASPTKQQSDSKSFLFPAYERVFGALRKLSLFTFLKRLVPDKWYHAFVDTYLLAHLVLAILSFALLPPGPHPALAAWLMGYGAFRCFELTVLHINQLLFDEHRVLRDDLEPDPLNYRRLVLSILHNYVELLFWFAFFYRHLASHFTQPDVVATASGSLYFSVVTMATVGYGDITPTDLIGREVVVAQIGLGLFLVIAVLARWVSIMRDIKRPEKLD
jgi:hypothetical protein